MLSTLLQLAGFACLVYGTYVVGGVGPAAFVGGISLLIVGQAADKVSVKQVATQARARLRKQKG